MKKTLLLSLITCLLAACGQTPQPVEKVVVAYVTSWTEVIPNPHHMTHINYAFGHVTDSFDGVRINNEARLQEIVRLKSQNPDLKVMLSIGGWGSGRFSEMAATDSTRLSFAADCQRVVEKFQLDGIDIDWEYPTVSAANISSSPDDTDNFTLMMRDIRAAIGPDKLLTLATVASAEYIDFKGILPYIDFVNIMAYDMANAPKHHAALYPSENSGKITVHQAVQAHLAAGVPAEKLVMGMPFYGRGDTFNGGYYSYGKPENQPKGTTIAWDSIAQVPYLINEEGTMVCGFDNPKSLAIKCEYILDNHLLGGMYWEYSDDNEQHELAETVANTLLKTAKQ